MRAVLHSNGIIRKRGSSRLAKLRRNAPAVEGMRFSVYNVWSPLECGNGWLTRLVWNSTLHSPLLILLLFYQTLFLAASSKKIAPDIYNIWSCSPRYLKVLYLKGFEYFRSLHVVVRCFQFSVHLFASLLKARHYLFPAGHRQSNIRVRIVNRSLPIAWI